MGKGQTAFYAVLGIAGMAILGMSFFHLAAGTESLTDGYMLTSQGEWFWKRYSDRDIF